MERKGARGKNESPPVHRGLVSLASSLRQLGNFCSSTNRAKKIDTFVRTKLKKRVDKYGKRVYNKAKNANEVKR